MQFFLRKPAARSPVMQAATCAVPSLPAAHASTAATAASSAAAPPQQPASYCYCCCAAAGRWSTRPATAAAAVLATPTCTGMHSCWVVIAGQHQWRQRSHSWQCCVLHKAPMHVSPHSTQAVDCNTTQAPIPESIAHVVGPRFLQSPLLVPEHSDTDKLMHMPVF